MLTRNERPRGRVLLATTDIPPEYHADRLRWWTVNSPSWSAHIDADQNRGALLAKLARKAIDLIDASKSPVVLDLGCGEGAFLRAFTRLAPSADLHGIDFCSAMLAEANRRSTGQGMTFTLADLEQPGFAPPFKADLVTSILAIDEMDQLEPAFCNMAEALAPDGVAMLVVMDPLKELERNRGDLGACLDGNAQLDNEILLVKTFPVAVGMEPAAPYSRIVRPLSRYTAAAIAAGLQPEPPEQMSHIVGIGPYSDTLSFDILIFRQA